MNNFEAIASHTRESIDNYVLHGLNPGGFLNAVLANDLSQAFARADIYNRMVMFDIVCYVYNKTPADCWGSYEVVNAWLGKFRKEEIKH